MRTEIPVGHVGSSMCGIDGHAGLAGMLAPFAVHPDHQRQGVGSALVHKGFDRLRDKGINQAYVLVDPEYYGRFGFKSDGSVAPPYKLPTEWKHVWQSISFSNDAPNMHEKIVVPEFWQHPHLWLP